MKILIVEDEPSLREIMYRALVQEHYVVETAATYADADAKVAGYSYDCILLDIMLPDGNGLRLLEHIKELRKRENVIIISARNSLEDKVLGLEQGADDYLPKPFVVGELLARIRALTRRSSALKTPELTFGDLLLDRVSFQLVCKDQTEHLGNKEFQIMEALIRRQGSPTSVEYLMDHIWGYDASVEPGVVWTYMSYLRRKLETLGSNVRITMRRGFGYMLEERK